VIARNPTRVVATGFVMPEAPLWDPDTAQLLVSDVMAGGVYAVTATGTEAVVEHRRGIGGLARHESGGLVVAGRNLAVKHGGETHVLAGPASDSATVRYNDLTVSKSGQVLVGSIDAEPGGRVHRPGHLHLVDLDGSVTAVAADIDKTNGLGFSPDESRLYHVDTGRGVIWAHPVSSDGTIHPDRSPLIRIDDGVPDGLAVAADGSVWVAVADRDGAGYVLVISPEAEVIDWIRLDDPSVTSLCFGGPTLSSVYVTLGATHDRSRRTGRVAVFETDTKGLPRPIARVPIDERGVLPRKTR
jgi:gluconolactonase